MESITVENGTITFLFGVDANAKLQEGGQDTLTLIPGTNDNEDIVWYCGGAGTTVLEKYLPASCRGNSTQANSLS